MPYRVLIADSGEPAVRIAITAREMGFIPLGLYTKEDTDAYHRRYMHEDKEVSSYFDAKEVVEAALELGADAVHPGYGLLNENPEFASEVTRKGLVFIGSSPSTISFARDKIVLKVYAEKMDIPTLPWAEVFKPEDVEEFAEVHGYPVVIRVADSSSVAARVARSGSEVEQALRDVKSRAGKILKDFKLYVEPYIANAKYVEVQVVSDGERTVHLYERECILRSNSKIAIAEAPSPSLSSTERGRLYEYAVLIAKSLRYVGVGSVVFILDLEKGEAYLADVKAGLQPGYSATEAITGIDIPRKQLEVALYHALDLKQEDVGRQGYAIEAVVYAENPLSGEPASGRVTRYLEPQGAELRVYSGISAGSSISGRYDFVVSRIVTWSPDRTTALRRMREALSEYTIEGVATNIRVLRYIVESREFAKALCTCGFYDEARLGIAEKLREELLVHSVIASAIVEYGDEGSKNLLKKQRVLERIVESERIRGIKRNVWYYYVALRSSLGRMRRTSRKKR